MRLFLLAAMLLALAAASPARAGQSYDNCSGFIDSIPATLTTQGVWCLRADLSTALTSGNAITIGANNITIDCNHFKLGGLAGGSSSQAFGISSDRLNSAVRNCNVRGFWVGIFLASGSGNLIESSRVDGSLYQGASIGGEGSVIRDTQVIDTGGSTANMSAAYGIYAYSGADVVGNTVSNVAAIGAVTNTYGIFSVANDHGTIRDNRIKGVVANGGGSARAIYTDASGRFVIRGNDVHGTGAAGSTGIRCGTIQGSAFQNVITGFAVAIANCSNSVNHINAN